MKHLRDLTPCVNCGGPVGTMFYVVRTSLALVSTTVVNQYLGMYQFFGGRAPSALLETVVPDVDKAVTVAGDKEPSLMVELRICMACYHQRPLDLPMLVERVREQHEGQAAPRDPADAVTS